MGEQGGSLRNVTLDVRGSDCVIKGIAMSGFGPVTQIYIGGKTPRLMRNLVIDDITVTRANYGILRQGFHNRMDDVKITNCRFSDLQGMPLSGMWRSTTATSSFLTMSLNVLTVPMAT